MTLIIDGTDAAFVHIPKCGGTWVKRALRAANIATTQPKTRLRCGAKHAALWGVENHIDVAFTLIRSPQDWLASWFKFQLANGWKQWETDGWHPQRSIECCKANTFEQFVLNVIDHQPGYVSRMYEHYAPTGACRYLIGATHRASDGLCEFLSRVLPQFTDDQREAIKSFPPQNVSKYACTNLSAKASDSLHHIERYAYERFASVCESDTLL